MPRSLSLHLSVAYDVVYHVKLGFTCHPFLASVSLPVCICTHYSQLVLTLSSAFYPHSSSRCNWWRHSHVCSLSSLICSMASHVIQMLATSKFIFQSANLIMELTKHMLNLSTNCLYHGSSPHHTFFHMNLWNTILFDFPDWLYFGILLTHSPHGSKS